MKKAAFALLILLLFPLCAWSTESIGTALNIVEDFSREANILIESRGFEPLPSAEKNKTTETLKRIRLTEIPGKDRSTKVYGVVSSYTESVVESVRSLKGKREDIEEITARLEKLKSGMLDGLRVSLVAESAEKKEPRPVPSLDLSPHDEPPAAPGNDKEGILFR
ncbi:MAG: hypothetical protein A2052_02445 [Deltaproteobacteria bacterium GWA2_54_12]|nr:MAG: hypothetical protein A2052_02445 [Deltaproteobacteria bacterium GWA2_54_12]